MAASLVTPADVHRGAVAETLRRPSRRCWHASRVKGRSPVRGSPEIERIDDRAVGQNDVLLAGGGWHVLQHQQALQ